MLRCFYVNSSRYTISCIIYILWCRLCIDIIYV
nr:MAG TPA: hypothetical protein [Caudoviricetes sp.]